MYINNLLFLIAQVPSERWLIAASVFGSLFILRIKMIKSHMFKDNIIRSKTIKHDIVLNLLKNIDTLHFLSNKVSNDFEVIGLFNTETTLLSLKTIDKIEKDKEKVKLLNDENLFITVKNYIDDAKYIFSSIYNMENELYDKKKSAEQLLLMYDRQYAKLNKEIDDEKTLTEIRYKFQKEINDFKSKVKSLEHTYKDYRTQMNRSIQESRSKNELIQMTIQEYSKKEIEGKKFYFREFVYA